MSDLTKAFDLPTFPQILTVSTKAIGYSTETEIADVIDNSIAAGASNDHIDFSFR